MTAPRSVEEWAKQCEHTAKGDPAFTLCSDCAESYARQRVEAFRERAAGLVETYKLMTPNRKSTGLRISLAAALRALEP